MKKPVTFRTQQVPTGKLLLKAGVISDSHLTPFPDNFGRMHSRSLQLVSAMVEKFNNDKMDFIFAPGDVTDKGRECETAMAQEAFKNAKMRVLYTRGNHDHVPRVEAKGEQADPNDKDYNIILHSGFKMDQSGWIKKFGRPSGIIVHNGVQIVWLNTTFGILDLPENVAVINAIDEKLPLIAFTHYQLVPDNYIAVKDKGSAIGETRDKKSIAEAPAGARKLLEKLARCKGLLLVGHKNIATTAKLGNLTQINMPQTTEYPAGTVDLKVYENGASLTFVPIADNYAEEYSRRRIAESSSRLRFRTTYTYPVWNKFYAW